MSRTKVQSYIQLPDSTPAKDRLTDSANRLDLKGITASYEELVQTATSKKYSFDQFTDQMLVEEMKYKEHLRVERSVKKAKMPFMTSIENFDFSWPRKIDREKIEELASCHWIDGGTNIIFFGPSGVGKTHLSVALGKEAILKGKDVRFINLMSLISLAKGTIRKKGAEIEQQDLLRSLLKTLSTVDVLILDEITSHEVDQKISDFLYQLFCDRTQLKKSFVINSNETFEGWDKIFAGNKNRANAVIDRLLERGVAFVIDADSYRLKNRLQGRKK